MCIREGDYVCRLGGDEFVLIFNKCDSRQAKQIVQRMKMHLLKGENNNASYPIDFSYGIAQYSCYSGHDAEGLIEIADKNKYADKESKPLKLNKNL